MKHISSKLILLTITLTTGLLAATAFFSFTLLKKESRAYTFQSQLLETQLFSETLQNQLALIQQLAAELLDIQTTPETFDQKIKVFFETVKKNHPELEGVGVQLHEGTPDWHSTPPSAFSNIKDRVETTQIMLQAVEPGKPSTLALVPAKNATLGFRINLEKSFKNCAGLQVSLLNSKQQVVYHCNTDQTALFNQAAGVLKEIKSSRLNAGTLERAINGQAYLWTYSVVEDFGYVVSVSTSSSANGPAYSLMSQVLLLILMAIGIAVVASIWMARKVTGPIEEVTRATQKISAGDFDAKIDINTRDETSTLARSVEAMAAKIKTLLVSEVQKTKLDAQMEVAGAVQRTLIPPHEVTVKNYQLSSYYHPADQCGGDWWGYVPGAKKLAILIGDVSGHGYPSALLVATTRGFLSMVEERAVVEGEVNVSPTDLLKSLNRVVFNATRAELNMTAFCTIIDLETGEFVAASAGHHPAYQVRSDGTLKILRSKGNRLGEHDEFESLPETIRGHLAKGDKLILFTDGVQDLGPVDSPLGHRGFKAFLSTQGLSTASEVVSNFKSTIYPIQEGRPLQDDITFVVIEGLT